MSSLSKSNLRLVMLPLAKPNVGFKKLYDSATLCWTEVWRQVYKNFSVEGPLFTDNLTRQDESACIFDADRCVGMLLFRSIDFSRFDFKQDSYFKEWENSDLERIFRHGSRFFITSYMSVLPEYRAYSPDFRFKELLFNFMIYRFLETQDDSILIMARRDRAINDEGVRRGGYLVRENVSYFSGRERVDLVAIPRTTAKVSDNKDALEAGHYLWSQRLDLTRPMPRLLRAA